MKLDHEDLVGSRMSREPEKATDTQLSRRTMVKCLGVGVGALAINILPGCTLFSNNPLTGGFKTSSQSKPVNQDLINETRKAWKSVLRAQNKIEQVDDHELERRVSHAKKKALAMVDDWDATGYSAQVDVILQAAPESFDYPEEVKQHYRQEFRDALTDKQFQKLEEFLGKSGTNGPANQILSEGGMSAHIRKELNEIQTQASMDIKFHALVSSPCLLGVSLCAAAAAIAIGICIAHPNTDICDNAWWAVGGACALAGVECLIEG